MKLISLFLMHNTGYQFLLFSIRCITITTPEDVYNSYCTKVSSGENRTQIYYLDKIQQAIN